MKKCYVCGNVLITDEPGVLFVGNAGDKKEICVMCGKHMGRLNNSINLDQLQSTINYFNNCAYSANDPEVASFLRKTIQVKVNIIKEQYTYQKNTFEEHLPSEIPWISAMRVCAWISFAIILIGGVVLAYQSGSVLQGSIIFLGSVLVAFLSIAGITIFLKMAKDIREIKNSLNKDGK